MKVPWALAQRSTVLLASTKRRCTGPYRKFWRSREGRRELESARNFCHGLLADELQQLAQPRLLPRVEGPVGDRLGDLRAS